MVVEGELHCRQPLCPIVLEVVNIGMEVHLNLLIHLLCLSICLWMESSTWICLYPNHGIEFLHEAGYELGPWSLMILCGTPWSQNTRSQGMHAVLSPVRSVPIPSISICFVNLSTMM